MEERRMVTTLDLLKVSQHELEAIRTHLMRCQGETETVSGTIEKLYVDLGITTDRDKLIFATGFEMHNMLIKYEAFTDPMFALEHVFGDLVDKVVSVSSDGEVVGYKRKS